MLRSVLFWRERLILWICDARSEKLHVASISCQFNLGAAFGTLVCTELDYNTSCADVLTRRRGLSRYLTDNRLLDPDC